MKNYTLDYLSAFHSFLEGQLSNVDQQLYEADDGEGRTIANAKETTVQLIDSTMRDLQDLRSDVKALSSSQFKEKHL